MVKRFSILCVFVATSLFAISCNKNLDQEVSVPATSDAQLYEVSVTVDPNCVEPNVKSDINPSASEKSYTNAYILAYNKTTGALVDYKAWSGSSVKFSLDKGTYTFYAVLNYGSDVTSAASSINNLLNLKATLKKDLNGFEMIGHSDITVPATDPCSITVKRVTAKVVMQNVKINFESQVLASSTFILKNVFIINAVGDDSFANADNGTAYTPTVWYNQLKYVSGDCNNYLYAGGINKTIAQGATYGVNKTFYVYPNATETDKHNGSFSARKTRIILEATINGETCYYPLTFASIGANKVYTVKSITITRKGIANPDDVWDDGSGTGSVIIGDWTEGGEYDETL